MQEPRSVNHSRNVLAFTAIALIVLAHCVARVYPFGDDISIIGVDPFVFLFRTLLLAFAYMGVPFGLFLLGSRLLKDDYTNSEDVLSYYKRPFLKTLIAVEIWIILNGTFNAVFYWGAPHTLGEMSRQILFLDRPENMPQAWILYARLILMLAVPFLSMAVKRFTFRALLLPFFFALLTSMVLPYVSQFGLIFAGSENALSTVLPLSASGGYLAIYFVAGYYIDHKRELRDFPVFLLSLIFLLGFVPNVLTQTQAVSRGRLFQLHVSSPLLFLSSVAAFELIGRCASRPVMERAFASLSRVYLGVLFCHSIFLALFSALLQKTQLIYPVRLAILFPATLVSGYILAFLIEKLGRVGKVLLAAE